MISFLCFSFRSEKATCHLRLFDGVRLLLGANSKSLLVFFGLHVLCHCILGDEIASTRDAVVLTETGLVFVQLLVQELFGGLGKHVFQHNLVDVFSVSLGLSGLAVLLVTSRVRTTALRSISHSFSVLFYYN